MTERAKAWLILLLTAGIPRILAALFLPNTFGDAYIYIRDIGVMSTKLKSGTFAFTDFYGFWLPLYQFLSAVLNVFVGNGFYAGKVVSAAFGVGVCLYVYAITMQLTQHRKAAMLAFLLIALNPVHILTSSSALTDVPHAFFVLASLNFVLKRSWLLGALFAALAGMTRVESWMLIALIPLIQFFRERRVSIPAVVIMLVPPLFWFYVSWKAAGDWLACFKSRQAYHDWLLQQNPALAHFSFAGVLKDTAMFIVSSDIAILCAALLAGWLVVRQLPGGKRSKDASQNTGIILPSLIFFFAFFALLVGAYLTHQQPIIFPRYGLILFSLGIPILAWTYFAITKRKPEWTRKLLMAIVVICVFQAGVQFVGGVGVLNQIAAQREVADYLRDHFDSTSNARIFSDEGTVTVMSGIPAEKFLTSADAPKDREAFLQYLKEKNVEYLVFINKVDSTPAKVLNDLDSSEPEPLEFVMNSYSSFLPTHIRLFRVRETGEPRR
jgi:dolichyl-phosphate-mannose-protein mannosyltransferase